MKKSKWRSKTFWINSATMVVGVITYLVGQDLVADNASLVAMLIAVQGAVNVGLRFVTSQPIK